MQQILTDESNGYGAKNVKDVKCNNGQSPTVKKGETFDCEVSIDGTKRQVTVTFQDNKGTYEVGRPSRSYFPVALAGQPVQRLLQAADRRRNAVLFCQFDHLARVLGGQWQGVDAVEKLTSASVATRTTGPAASM